MSEVQATNRHRYFWSNGSLFRSCNGVEIDTRLGRIWKGKIEYFDGKDWSDMGDDNIHMSCEVTREQLEAEFKAILEAMR